MYDPYPPRPTLRLGLDLQAVKSHHEERADIRRQIESLLVRHCELTMLIDAEHAQSQPIRISSPYTDNDFWTHRHRVMGGAEPKVARSNGYVAPLVRPAATGDARDPAENLRFSRMMHEPLYEDDGA